MSLHIIVLIVVFVVWVEENTSAIVMIVACASIYYSLMITTVKLGNTCLIVQCVRRIYSAVEMRRTKCKNWSLLRVLLFLLFAFQSNPESNTHAQLSRHVLLGLVVTPFIGIVSKS
jgi:hypothetical protein